MHTALLWPCCRAICIPWLWSSTAVASRLCIFCGCAAVNCLPFCCKTRIFNFILNTSVGPGGNWIQTLLRTCRFLTFEELFIISYSFFFHIGNPKLCSFISLENALWSWGNLNSILVASMFPMDGSTGKYCSVAKESFPAGVRHEAAKGEGGRHLGIVSFSWCKLLGDDWIGRFFSN